MYDPGNGVLAWPTRFISAACMKLGPPALRTLFSMSSNFCSSSTNTKPHCPSALVSASSLYWFDSTRWTIKQDESQAVTQRPKIVLCCWRKPRIFCLIRVVWMTLKGKVRAWIPGLGSQTMLLCLWYWWHWCCMSSYILSKFCYSLTLLAFILFCLYFILLSFHKSWFHNQKTFQGVVGWVKD